MKNEGPRDLIEHFGNIQFEKDMGFHLFAQGFNHLLNKIKIIIDASSPNKSTLARWDQVGQ